MGAEKGVVRPSQGMGTRGEKKAGMESDAQQPQHRRGGGAEGRPAGREKATRHECWEPCNISPKSHVIPKKPKKSASGGNLSGRAAGGKRTKKKNRNSKRKSNKLENKESEERERVQGDRRFAD